jgi:hypothetical protein
VHKIRFGHSCWAYKEKYRTQFTWQWLSVIKKTEIGGESAKICKTLVDFYLFLKKFVLLAGFM